MQPTTVPAIYPRMIRRVRALLIDSVIIGAVLYSWIFFTPVISNSPVWIKVAALVVPLLFVEPVLVAITGGTPGHHLMGLRVRLAKCDENIGVLRAVLRMLFRIVLGLFSFLFVLTTKRHQALHDFFTGTVVVLRHPDSLPPHEKFTARTDDLAHYQYPSAWRRLIVIIGYLILGFLALAIFNALAISQACLEQSLCNASDKSSSTIFSLAWLASVGATVLLGWRGRLWGGRRVRRPVELTQPNA